MINDLQNEKIILEIKDLVNDVNNVKEEINVYCHLMKQIFLSGSGQN